MTTQVPPKRGVAFYFETGLFSQADTNILQVNPTLAAGDVVVYKDGVLDGNIDTLPVAIGGGKLLACVFSIAEMTADRTTAVFSDVLGGQWQDQIVTVHTVATSQIDDLSTAASVAALNDLDAAGVRAAVGLASANLDTQIAALPTDADVQAAATASLNAYDPPTKAELDSAVAPLATSVALAVAQADLDNPDQYKANVSALALEANVQTHAAAALTAYDPPTKAELDAGLAGLNDLSAAEVQAEAEDALEAYDLDHLIQVSAGSEEPTDGSYLDQVMHKSASQSFDATTDSLEAIRDRLASATVNVTSVVDGGTITVQAYTTWIVTRDEATVDLSGRDANGAFVTVKGSKGQADTEALVQVQEGVGLVRLNGAAAAAAGKGGLVINVAENGFTLTVDESVTGLTAASRLHWDLKRITTGNVQQVARGTWVIEDVVTRAVTV